MQFFTFSKLKINSSRWITDQEHIQRHRDRISESENFFGLILSSPKRLLMIWILVWTTFKVESTQVGFQIQARSLIGWYSATQWVRIWTPSQLEIKWNWHFTKTIFWFWRKREKNLEEKMNLYIRKVFFLMLRTLLLIGCSKHTPQRHLGKTILSSKSWFHTHTSRPYTEIHQARDPRAA